MAELDDDREGIEPEVLDENAGDPAAAFDALREKVEHLSLIHISSRRVALLERA